MSDPQAPQQSQPIQLDELLDSFRRDIAAWLDQPAPETERMQSIRSEIEAMKDRLGADAVKAAVAALDGAKPNLKRQRQTEATAAIAAAMKPLGIRLKPEPPAKRKSRKSNQ